MRARARGSIFLSVMLSVVAALASMDLSDELRESIFYNHGVVSATDVYRYRAQSV